MMTGKKQVTVKQAGLSPGTMVHIGEKKQENIRIRLIDFDESHLKEVEVKSVEECYPYKDRDTTTWINIDGLHQIETIEKICNHYQIHPLVQEDIVHTGQRPKMERFPTFYYFVLKMLSYDDRTQEIKDEQLSLILGSNFILTLQEQSGDVFNPVRGRIRTSGTQIRKRKPDYLAYALIDTVVDYYFFILGKLDEQLDHLDEELFRHTSKGLLKEIYKVKRKIIAVRKSVWPIRDIVGSIGREDSDLIDTTSHVYFKDMYDHVIQVVETIDTFREIAIGMLDTYMTNVSNKMNEVMKVLTIIATIFIPITFVAGVYGMNFEFMPELAWKYGYPGVWGVILAISIGMFVFFRKKKWL